MKTKTNKKQVLDILDLLNFEKTFTIFHVGGTNGKGSVANYLQQGFSTRYKLVGLFTSPHIFKVNERIQINDQYISNQDLYEYSQKVLNIKKDISFIALMYIISLLYFQDSGVELVVLEVGIGGKHDNTSFVPGEFGVITSVAKDHVNILGDSLKEIAINKSGIMSKHMTYYIPSSLKLSIKTIFYNTALKVGANIVELLIKENDYQIFNKTFSRLILKDFSIEFNKFTTPFGRTTLIQYNNTLHIMDVAHNFSAIQSSLQHMDMNNIQYHNICLSLSNDKDIHLIKNLFNNDTYIYENSSHRSRKLNKYDFGQPIYDLKKFIHSMNKPTLFIGSFYFISDVMKVINE